MDRIVAALDKLKHEEEKKAFIRKWANRLTDNERETCYRIFISCMMTERQKRHYSNIGQWMETVFTDSIKAQLQNVANQCRINLIEKHSDKHAQRHNLKRKKVKAEMMPELVAIAQRVKDRVRKRLKKVEKRIESE